MITKEEFKSFPITQQFRKNSLNGKKMLIKSTKKLINK